MNRFLSRRILSIPQRGKRKRWPRTDNAHPSSTVLLRIAIYNCYLHVWKEEKAQRNER